MHHCSWKGLLKVGLRNLYSSRIYYSGDQKRKNVVKWIKGQRISWFGHLERMEEDRMPKKILTQELEETRRRGRPRKRRKEEVERDLQVLGVRRCRELVWQIVKNGRTLLDRPKPTVSCTANGRRRIIKKGG